MGVHGHFALAVLGQIEERLGHGKSLFHQSRVNPVVGDIKEPVIAPDTSMTGMVCELVWAALAKSFVIRTPA
jgi:hypothetical protein